MQNHFYDKKKKRLLKQISFVLEKTNILKERIFPLLLYSSTSLFFFSFFFFVLPFLKIIKFISKKNLLKLEIHYFN